MSRLSAAATHLLISTLVACLAALLVFGLWYPGPFTWLAGGRDLFFLVCAVDVVLGPLLTFTVFGPTKDRRELRRDLAIIGVVQLAALCYGLHTVYVARPVAMVFEVDRIRLIAANDVAEDDLAKAPPAYRPLPMAGPLLLSARRPRAGSERNDALFQGLAGNDIGNRPQFWQPYEDSKSEALAKSKPLSALLARYPDADATLRQQLAELHADTATGRFLPAVARGGARTAVLDAKGDVLGYLKVDGFI